MLRPNEATNSMANATYFTDGSGAASRYFTVRITRAEQLSLIIPNASTHGPPTSSAVPVNLRPASLITKATLLTG